MEHSLHPGQKGFVMKNVLLTILAGAAMFAVASPAAAQVTTTFVEGVGGIQAGETLFASFDGGLNGGVVCGGTGCVIQSANNSQGAPPAVGDQGDNYLAVLGGGTATFNFAGGLSRLGLDFGSADTYNLFTLALAGGGSLSFTGQQLIDIGIADGNQSSVNTNGRLTFTANPGVIINGLTISSSSNSAEVDNFGRIGAVPEPATWAMMLIGFGAIGGSMRRRRRGGTLAIAQIA